MANLAIGIPYLKRWEGGLSRATSDKASSDPSPYVHEGVTGWHTNKGVTWSTFKSGAKVIGYAINKINFLQMPDLIWIKIFEQLYADPMSAKNCISDAVGVALVDFLWGSGGAKKVVSNWLKSKYGVIIYNGKNYDMKKAVAFINTKDEKTMFLEIVNIRRAYYKSLNDPGNIKGWLARVGALEKFGLDLIKKKVKTKPRNPFVNFTRRNFFSNFFGSISK